MNKRSLVKLGSKNPAWKGINVGYMALHAYVRRRKSKPKLCESCGVRPATDLANKTGKYLRDLTDWEYLCRKCHMDGDGRNEQLRESGKSRRLPSKNCIICHKNFHRTYGMKTAKYCSLKCSIKGRIKSGKYVGRIRK